MDLKIWPAFLILYLIFSLGFIAFFNMLDISNKKCFQNAISTKRNNFLTCLDNDDKDLSSNLAINQNKQFKNTGEVSKMTGFWDTINSTNYPIARHENGFAEHEGKLYLLGGRRIQNISVFNLETHTWSYGAPPPIELHHFQAVTYNHKIWIVCALTGSFPNEKPVANIYLYDPLTDQWEIGPVIPESRRRGSAGVVVCNNVFYVACGIVDGHNGDFKTWFDSYDPNSNQWKILPDAPRPRDHFHLALVHKKLYAIGGRTTSRNTNQTFELTVNEIDQYDLITEKWITLPKQCNIPTPRAGCMAAVINNEILIMGGESSFQEIAHSETEAFNTEKNTWHLLSHMKQGRHGTQAIVFQDKIYIAGGCGKRGGSPELISIESFTK